MAPLDGLRPYADVSPYVFPGRSDGGLTNGEKAIDRAREREGLAHFTPHDRFVRRDKRRVRRGDRRLSLRGPK